VNSVLLIPGILAVAFLLVLGIVITVYMRRNRRKKLTGSSDDIRGLLTDDRDIFDIYDKPGAFDYLWRPLAREMLPGEPFPLTTQEATEFGMRNPSETYMTRGENGDAYWFFVPNHARPGLFMGLLLDPGALPKDTQLHKITGNGFINLGGLEVPLFAPEILARSLAKPWWEVLDATSAPALERKSFINLTPNGLIRIGRSFTAVPTMRVTGWTAARLERLLAREAEVLEQIAQDFAFSLEITPESTREEILIALLESCASQSWPRQPENSDFPERLRRQREALATAIIEPERRSNAPAALARLLELSLCPEHEWLRDLLTRFDGKELMDFPDARLPLCVAWLARFKDPNHSRVERHFVALDSAQLDHFTEIVLAGLIAGEPLVQSHLRRYLKRLEPEDQWRLLSVWVATRPVHVWGWVREYFTPELWEVIVRRLREGDVGAARALIFHERFDELVEAHLLDLTPAQQGSVLAGMIKHPIDPLAEDLARIPEEHIRENARLGVAYLHCVGRLSPELKQQHARAYEQRLVVLLTNTFKLDKLSLVIEVLEQIGQRAALIAIVAFSKEAPRPLLPALERARGVIYERTPDVETGALSLAITDDIQGALTQADGAGGLAMVDPADESHIA
jgi:hypothetical protein